MAKRYKVEVNALTIYTLFVNAKSKKEASDIALDILYDNDMFADYCDDYPYSIRKCEITNEEDEWV